jgi:hypothetical protein
MHSGGRITLLIYNSVGYENYQVLGTHMKPRRPLLLTTCIRCGAKHFVRNPRPHSTCTAPMRTYEEARSSTPACEMIPFTCLKCDYPQFAEACYPG